MTKTIAVTQQKDKTLYMIGEYQATLWHDRHWGVWKAEYLRKGQPVLTSSTNDNHPIMPNSALDQPRARAIVQMVLGCLQAGIKVTQDLVYPPAPKARRTTTRSRIKTPKVVTAYQVLDCLLTLVEDSCTVLVPMGKTSALKATKVRIVDSEGETLCEIPYPIFKRMR